MKFLERVAMKLVERSMRENDKKKRIPHDAEIVPAERLTPQSLERMQQEIVYWRRRAAQSEAELAELQKLETLGNIEEHHREKQIRAYLHEIEQLNLRTPGGLRSQPLAEDGEDQELLNEAWLRYCGRRAGGRARF